MLEPDQLEQGLELFARLVEEDEDLREEFRRSAAQYFLAGEGPAPQTPEGISAARRHLEWFLFERIGDPVRELVAEQLLPRWRERADPELATCEETFLESHAGIFAVTDVEAGKGAWLEDLAGLGRYPVAEAEASRLLAADDLIVGRLYPVGEALYRISLGAGFFREPDLVRALEGDMRRLRLSRSHQVLRIAQRELEATFWGADRWAGGLDPVGGARRTLLSGGVPRERVEAILAALEAVPLDPENPTPGVGDALGRALEELAFHSQVDLGVARGKLLLAWQHLSRPDRAPVEPSRAPREVPPSDAPDEDLRRAIADLDQRLQSGQDVSACFDQLERALGLDRIPEAAGPDAEPDAEFEAEDELDAEAPSQADTAKVPDFPGVVGAMVEEFQWELGAFGTPLSERQVTWLRLFAHVERGLGVFEELTLADVLRFAVFWLPERGGLASAGEVSEALGALERFCAWAEENHALPHLGGAVDKLAALREGLQRVSAANRCLRADPQGSGSPDPQDEESGELFELLERVDRGLARVRDSRGGEHELAASAEVLRLVQPGDRLRASRADGRLVIHCCYPPQLAQLV